MYQLYCIVYYAKNNMKEIGHIINEYICKESFQNVSVSL